MPAKFTIGALLAPLFGQSLYEFQSVNKKRKGVELTDVSPGYSRDALIKERRGLAKAWSSFGHRRLAVPATKSYQAAMNPG